MNDEEYVRMLEQEQSMNREYGQMPMGSPSMFNHEDNDNLVKWQLDIKEELVRIEHLLRKHVPKTDSEGNVYYAESSKEDQLFNEKGINEILNLLAWYLNKNIILSNYGEDQIKLRMDQFTRYLTDFIFMNYQRFGLDTLDKMKHYPMIVMNVVNTIEAAYFRALNGGERDSLRTARTVNQTEPLSNYGNYPGMMPPQQNKFSIFRPTTWVKR
tara:strand:+ start:4090 stop:4728 length:639 start_codon:yes stop_codon:yes gene_type:complete